MNNYIKLMNMYGDSTDNIEMELKKIDDFIDKKTDNLEVKSSNYLIIGKAGIGKSTYISKNYSPHDYLMVSYTGIAAAQINGSTISSAFKLGRFNENTVSKCISKMKAFSDQKILNLQIIKGIVIDEFYTVPAAVMEKVDLICQQIRQSTELFGGLQLILVGDDRQTECVEHAFVNTELFTNLNCEKIVLQEHEHMRLTQEYMKFCDMFRNPKFNRDKMIRMLKSKRFSQKEVPGYIVYYTNDEINKRNIREMSKFDSEVIHKEYKKGCPIYITSTCGDICNGMIGKLIDKKNNRLFIEIDDKIHNVTQSQIDFKPGFALSIHKSQAKTFPGINIYIRLKDLMRDRAKYIRLLYVALTRVRNFDKCYIKIY